MRPAEWEDEHLYSSYVGVKKMQELNGFDPARPRNSRPTFAPSDRLLARAPEIRGHKDLSAGY